MAMSSFIAKLIALRQAMRAGADASYDDIRLVATKIIFSITRQSKRPGKHPSRLAVDETNVPSTRRFLMQVIHHAHETSSQI